jgi:hypothetical protein
VSSQDGPVPACCFTGTGMICPTTGAGLGPDQSSNSLRVYPMVEVVARACIRTHETGSRWSITWESLSSGFTTWRTVDQVWQSGSVETCNSYCVGLAGDVQRLNTS